MKKYLALAAVATMLAACTNEEVTQADSLKDTPITVASAGVGELTASRTTDNDVVNHPFGLFVESTSDDAKYEAANMKWTYNDGWGSDETLLFEGADKQTAYAYHPYNENAAASYTFTTDGTTDLLWWKSEGALTGNSLSIEFAHALSKLTVNLKKNSEIGTADLGNVTIGGTILKGTADLAEQSWTLEENAAASNIAATATTATSGYDKTVEVLLLPQTATFSVVIEVGEKTFIWTSAEQDFAPGTAYTLNLTVGKDVTSVAEVRVAEWNAETIEGDMAKECEHNTISNGICTECGKLFLYVDLGLTSGTLWATRNVGADNPWDYGDYFAWGETSPKTSYTWDEYRWGTQDNLTKYNSADGLTTLEADDDAATANMGADWKTPTADDWTELINNCTWTWTTLNGANGYTIVGSNGNSIFLPASGQMTPIGPNVVNYNGYYNSSSLNEDKTKKQVFGFGNNVTSKVDGLFRYLGHPVRAIKKQ